jgi:hypothetical protein
MTWPWTAAVDRVTRVDPVSRTVDSFVRRE